MQSIEMCIWRNVFKCSDFERTLNSYYPIGLFTELCMKIGTIYLELQHEVWQLNDRTDGFV